MLGSFKGIFRTLFCGLLILGVSVAVFAQFKAGLQGTVTDNNGGVVSNATVTLKNNETNQTQTTKHEGCDWNTCTWVSDGYVKSVNWKGRVNFFDFHAVVFHFGNRL